METLRSKFPKVINALYVAEQIHEKDLSVLSMPTYRYTHTHKIIGEYSFSFYKYDVHVLSYIARLSLDTISISVAIGEGWIIHAHTHILSIPN